MLETLEHIDQDILLAVNSAHNPFFDAFFWIISGRFVWLPLYVLLAYLIQREFGWKKLGFFLIIVALTIAVVDISSVYLFKELFERYRPSHHAIVGPQLHLHMLDDGSVYKGGMYGFISSHASNFFAITGLVGLTLRKRYPLLIYIMLLCSLLVCYSRMYLGVHYLSDVFVGALWGFMLAWTSYTYLVKRVILKN
jgi:undecaprenyl-diphosphatase